jgi:hypothetical protein
LVAYPPGNILNQILEQLFTGVASGPSERANIQMQLQSLTVADSPHRQWGDSRNLLAIFRRKPKSALGA